MRTPNLVFSPYSLQKIGGRFQTTGFEHVENVNFLFCRCIRDTDTESLSQRHPWTLPTGGKQKNYRSIECKFFFGTFMAFTFCGVGILPYQLTYLKMYI